MRTRTCLGSLVVVSIVGLLALLPGAALAQDLNLGGVSPSISAPSTSGASIGAVGPKEPSGSGALRSSTWIAAHKFTATNNNANPRLTYSANHFYNSPGTGSPVYYFAPLELEPGLLVDLYTCVYNDGSATNDLTFDLQRTTIDLSARTAGYASLGDGSSSGSAGIGFVNIPLDSNETIQNQVGNTYYNYVLRAAVSEDTSFAGCMVYWTRQVSAAPATARFTDVPTSHPYFPFIEALYSSGITSGCGPTTFCPDRVLTRGEMAVFLASGLGLSYPN